MNSKLEVMQEIRRMMQIRDVTTSEMINFLNNPVDVYGLSLKDSPPIKIPLWPACTCVGFSCNGHCAR